MTFKRHIDRLPIIPADAKEHNVVCQFCIVGCGYQCLFLADQRTGGCVADLQRLRRRPREAASFR